MNQIELKEGLKIHKISHNKYTITADLPEGSSIEEVYIDGWKYAKKEDPDDRRSCEGVSGWSIIQRALNGADLVFYYEKTAGKRSVYYHFEDGYLYEWITRKEDKGERGVMNFDVSYLCEDNWYIYGH